MNTINRCHSVKSRIDKNQQCPYKKRVGNLCLIHHKAKKVRLFIKDKKVDNEDNNTNQNAKLSGPAFNNICLSHDPIDIVSLEVLWEEENGTRVDKCEFDKALVFSYTDGELIRCLNIRTLYSMFKNDLYLDPFTNRPLCSKVIKRAKDKIAYLTNKGVPMEVKDEFQLTKEKELDLRILEVFQKFTQLGFFLENGWLLELDVESLQKIYVEGTSIWQAFVQDNYGLSRTILPVGTVFKSYIDVKQIQDIFHLRTMIINEFDKLVSSSESESAQKMGAYIAIGIFAYVSQTVKAIYQDYIYN